jgi:hypothetical protein
VENEKILCTDEMMLNYDNKSEKYVFCSDKEGERERGGGV